MLALQCKPASPSSQRLQKSRARSCFRMGEPKRSRGRPPPGLPRGPSGSRRKNISQQEQHPHKIWPRSKELMMDLELIERGEDKQSGAIPSLFALIPYSECEREIKPYTLPSHHRRQLLGILGLHTSELIFAKPLGKIKRAMGSIPSSLLSHK